MFVLQILGIFSVLLTTIFFSSTGFLKSLQTRGQEEQQHAYHLSFCGGSAVALVHKKYEFSSFGQCVILVMHPDLPNIAFLN